MAAIIADVNEQPGALPLLQYALTDLFDHRSGKTITLDVYQRMGGIRGALARRADEVFVALNRHQQAIARQLFLRLITLGEGTEDTRRRVLCRMNCTRLGWMRCKPSSTLMMNHAY